MKTLWTFETATAFWTKWRDAETASDDVLDAYAAAEAYLLKLKPADRRQADMLFTVVMDQMGERADGLEREALSNLQAYVRSLPDLEGGRPKAA